MKRHKAPGPDGMTAEVIKELDLVNLSIVVDMLNDWWMEGRVPNELTRAEVVLIYKQGNTAEMGNYRPISLLNTMYKVLAVVLKTD